MPVRVGINGFGRIGRALTRLILKNSRFQITAINDTADTQTLSHLLQYDSIYSKFDGSISFRKDTLLINGSRVRCMHCQTPALIPWSEEDVEIVVESSGFFTSKNEAAGHLRGGCAIVLIAAASQDADVTLCYGVNNSAFDPQKHRIISNASCTAHCLAPVLKVLHDTCGIVNCFMTTVHSYTTHQSLLDSPNKDLRRTRAAALSIIPTTTSSIPAVEHVLPFMRGKIVGSSLRVPTPAVSMIDLSVNTEENSSVREVNGAFRNASRGTFKGILGYTDEELVSLDFKGSPYSAIVDSSLTSMLGRRFVKISAWYDNEWGYSCRLIDTLEFISKTMKLEGYHE